MSASFYEFGVSIPKVPAESCLLLAPPLGRQTGEVFVIHVSRVWKLELTDDVLSEHRNKLGITYEPAKKVAKPHTNSEAVLNYEFVHDHVKPAVNALDYTIYLSEDGPPSVDLKYTVNHVPCRSDLAGFTTTTAIELMKTMSKELHRVYDVVHEMKETASAQGVDLSTVNSSAGNHLAVVEKLQQAELRRANLSSVNPNMRSKKVTKGFGSK